MMREPSGLAIRAFAPSDQAAARRLILEGLGEHFGAVDGSCNPDIDDIAANYIGRGHLFLVAEDALGLVGTAALVFEEGASAQVVRVSVAPCWRRRGLAKALVMRLIEAGTRAGSVGCGWRPTMIGGRPSGCIAPADSRHTTTETGTSIWNSIYLATRARLLRRTPMRASRANGGYHHGSFYQIGLGCGDFVDCAGLLFLAGQLFPGMFGRIGPFTWPVIVVGVGVFLFVLGLITGNPGMSVPACVVGGIGLLLYWQNATGNFASWAYAWTLIPGFVGVGVILEGLLAGHFGRGW